MKWINTSNNDDTKKLAHIKLNSWKRIAGAILCTVIILANQTDYTAAATVAETSDQPLVPADMLEEWDDEAQMEYLELYGENPSMTTLQRFGISRVYTADGKKVEVDATKNTEGVLYADTNQQTQYIYYGGYIYLINNKVQGKLIKPTQVDGIEVQTYTDSGHGYVVENQNYGFERLNKGQSCALLHFMEEESGDPILGDYVVFFDRGDLIRITYPKVEGLQPLSSGCWSWNAFESTVEYYKPEGTCKSVSSKTFVGDDSICVNVQPDGCSYWRTSPPNSASRLQLQKPIWMNF